jgi:hypothetical protein
MRIKVEKYFHELIEAEPEYQAGLIRHAAGPVVDYAKRIAPVGSGIGGSYEQGYGEPGDYRRSLKVVIRGGHIFVTAMDWKAHWIEWGTVDTPTFATIRRAVRESGLDLEELER